MVRNLMAAAAAATLAWSLAGHSEAQAQLEPVPGTPMVTTSDWGELPKEIVWPHDGSVMVLVPAGRYRIGTGGGVDGLQDAPETEVELSSFYIDKFEVSQEQFNAFRKARPGESLNLEYGSQLQADDFPALAVNWFSAQDYAAWAQKELPSEAMWEVAARGPSANEFTTGATPDLDAIVVGKGASGKPSPAKTETGDVSAFGAVNMAGNVREFTVDAYRRDAYASLSGVNPQTTADTSTRVVRGGSWLDRAEPLRVNPSRRIPVEGTETREDIGFRTVFVLREQAPPTPTPEPSPSPVKIDPVAARDRTIAQLATLFAEGAERLPPELRATPNSPTNAFMANYTPYDLLIAMVDSQGRVPVYGLRIPSFTFATVPVPSAESSSRLYLVGYPATHPKPEPRTLGEIAGAPGFISLIMPDNFDEVTVIGGDPLPRKEEGEAISLYEMRYSPQWDEVNFSSTLPLPVRISITPLDSKGAPTGTPQTLTLGPGAVGQAKLDPGRYTADAVYVGTTEDACEPLMFNVNGEAARRLIRFDGDAARGTIQVFASQAPFIVAQEKRATLPPDLSKAIAKREAEAKKASGKK